MRSARGELALSVVRPRGDETFQVARSRNEFVGNSGVHLFDNEPAPVYIDDCCHYTLVGYGHLADFIAASTLKSPGPWSRPH